MGGSNGPKTGNQKGGSNRPKIGNQKGGSNGPKIGNQKGDSNGPKGWFKRTKKVDRTDQKLERASNRH